MAPRIRRRLLPQTLTALGLALAATAASLVLVAPAAHAHDALVSSDPAAGAVLTESPDAISLIFSAELLSDGTGAQMEVTDPSGISVTSGVPVVEGVALRQDLAPAASAGSYRVLWRVVSSDGHPISGEFSYTVAAPTVPATAPPTPTERAAGETASADPASPVATPEVVETAADSEMLGVITIVAVIAVVAGIVSVVVVVLAVGRSRRSS